jgi:hypothetical protein
MNIVVLTDGRLWCLADVEGQVNPLSQGGDTGSNPVGAAKRLIIGAFCWISDGY